MEDVIGAIASKQTVLNEMLASTAYEFIPNFIMSEDFASYFDSHYAPMKAIAKNFHVDSKVNLTYYYYYYSDNMTIMGMLKRNFCRHYSRG